MNYEPRFERFDVTGPAGEQRAVQFLRAGTLSVGDRPELYFFRVAGENEDIAVGISGSALKDFEHGRRCLNREEKIDVAGLLLKRQLETGLALHSQALFIRDAQLAELAGLLGIPALGGR
jgi:hypothetical protein